jgi:hypothetical protein
MWKSTERKFPRYSIPALEKIWTSIEKESICNVTQQELATALKSRADIHSVLQTFTQCSNFQGQRQQQQSMSLQLFITPDNLQRSRKCHRTIVKVKEIVREVDWNCGGTAVDFDGFVNTFRKHGMLLD